MKNYLLNQFVVSAVIGASTTASTYLGSMIYEPKDWRDLVLYGMIGAIISSKYIHKHTFVAF
jgi:hypothetical protein|tara:strand:- start:329 stop:514 length:186 start_codon:yes stop_codon:yes gene_type:complete